jgi:hypothetical protein
MTTWDSFRNSGGWPYETESEVEQRAAEHQAEVHEHLDQHPEQPGRQRQPTSDAPTG